MITPSIIYAAVTILLAFVDALRIKVRWGKTGNINHDLSYILALLWGGTVLMWWGINTGMELNWWTALALLLAGIGMCFIRLALFDPCLNIFRILTKTNPTGKIDYVSSTTSSYEDQHSEKVSFWWKRVLGMTGWVVMYFLYRLIFKV